MQDLLDTYTRRTDGNVEKRAQPARKAWRGQAHTRLATTLAAVIMAAQPGGGAVERDGDDALGVIA
eukprot:10456152-Alexandrium_andersonii.AAC.1